MTIDKPADDSREETSEPREGTRQGAEDESRVDADQPREGGDEADAEPDYRELYRKARSEIKRLVTRSKETKPVDPAVDQRVVAIERERDEAREQLRRERTEGRIRAEAVRQGAVDADAVVRLIESDEIDYDDDGKPTNIGPLVKDLLRAKTYLTTRRTPSADAGEGTQGGSANRGINDVIRDLAGSKRRT